MLTEGWPYYKLVQHTMWQLVEEHIAWYHKCPILLLLNHLDWNNHFINRLYLKLELYNFTYLCTCELVFCCFLTEEIATGRQPD